jgi:hypothetical protein
MNFKTTCISCGQRFEAADEHIGLTIICPNCEEEFIVEKIAENLPESYMSITEATKIAECFTDVLADKKTTFAPTSLLPASKVRILKAMMLWLARLKKDGHFEHVKSVASTAAGGLITFVDLDDCVIANDDSIGVGHPQYPRKQNAHDKFASDLKKGIERKEISAFVAELEKLFADDPLYWQKVYTLAGVSMTPPESEKKGFWSGIFGR